ncbi:NADH-ubiquinone oxidoreductase-F iron-sulfur binding region domain-containing protein [Pedococcus bigeumensis]|uniref:NADH-ubiquinone oxidoreductase-F iron-sulfur binding region domain-containing protein n=1 Tax=Pedococcus bigeumensis TaxID=433644 RepID=UPI002FEBAA8A
MTQDLLDLLDVAGLTGRGGAAFSTATKIRVARKHRASLIVNACDGEIGAAKDAYVVAEHLDALVRGASIVAGRRRVRYAAHRGSATEARLREAGLDVLSAPGRYVASEETSLISLAQGGLARPMTKRAPFVRGGTDSEGRRIRPTLVLNAETVWRVAQVVDHGPEWFRRQGLPGEPGPRLVAVGGAVESPGVLDVVTGTSLAEILAVAGADPAHVGPVVVGGLGGVLLGRDEALRTAWSSAALAEFGGRIGPGVVHVLDQRVCPVEEMGRWLDYAAGESAGQCGPCMFGLPSLAADWHALADFGPEGKPARRRLAQRAQSLVDRGACRFPDGVAGLATSALRVLDDHLAEHARGRCGAHPDLRRTDERHSFTH